MIIKKLKQNDKNNKRLKILELMMSHWYPLGDDSFKINHGDNYFSFFNRLGKVLMIGVIFENILIATNCCVLRKIYDTKVWYLCDLKVHKLFRNKFIPFKMFWKYFIGCYKITRKCYGITMDTKNTPNKVIKLASHVPFIKMDKIKKLILYSLDYKQMIQFEKYLKKSKNDIFYLSLIGKKDIILQSSGKPMNLLHIQWGKKRNEKDVIYETPQKDYQHMFCLLSTDVLNDVLIKMNIVCNSTASIISYNMSDYDFSFVLTSDI